MSLIFHRGIPAIWFTLNPNDLTTTLRYRPQEQSSVLMPRLGSGEATPRLEKDRGTTTPKAPLAFAFSLLVS
jgi:hypothetical protein